MQLPTIQQRLRALLTRLDRMPEQSQRNAVAALREIVDGPCDVEQWGQPV